MSVTALTASDFAFCDYCANAAVGINKDAREVLCKSCAKDHGAETYKLTPGNLKRHGLIA